MIKIICKDLELKVETSTLTLITKNTAFSDSFSLEYSQHPFLIIEEENTVEALGSRHILSLLKKKEYDVTVFRDNKVYFGKLRVLSYVTNARKCDLVFGSELLKILDRPIADFMPVVYFGENGKPYSETITEKIAQQSIVDALFLHEKKKYPEALFQFPEIYAPNFYDKEENDGEWDSFKGYLNKRGVYRTHYASVFDPITFSVSSSNKLLFNPLDTGSSLLSKSYNYNSFCPFVYLSAALDSCLSFVNFKRESTRNEFLDNILLFSGKTGDTLFSKEEYSKEINLLNYNWTSSSDYDHLPTLPIDIYTKYIVIPTADLGVGKFIIKFSFDFTLPGGTTPVNPPNPWFVGKLHRRKYDPSNPLADTLGETIFVNEWDETAEIVSGEFSFDITASDLEGNFSLIYSNTNKIIPSTYNISILSEGRSFNLHQVSATVDLSRHVPDWTVAELLNNYKNLFNLKIDLDDSLKTLTLDFIDEYLNNTEMVDLSNYKLELKSYENNQSNAFKISYANEEFVRIDKVGITTDDRVDKDIVEITNGFLTPSFNGTHHKVNKEDVDDGVILVLSKTGTKNTTQIVDGITLNLSGDKGIGNTFWKSWVSFRQNASKLSLVGNIHKHDLIRIEEFKKVYYDNVVFLVDEIRTKEKNGYLETNLIIQSKVF